MTHPHGDSTVTVPGLLGRGQAIREVRGLLQSSQVMCRAEAPDAVPEAAGDVVECGKSAPVTTSKKVPSSRVAPQAACEQVSSRCVIGVFAVIGRSSP